MNRLYPTDLVSFQRKYRLAGGKLRRVRIRYGAGDKLTIEFVLAARTALRDLGTEPRPIRLRFRLKGTEEFRFQKRPTIAGGKISDARIGYFQELFFINLDAWTLEPGEAAKVHDFRASDAYLAGSELWWEELPETAPPKGNGAK
ncbi:hypothetical protein [Fimbriiglobus ruber]|uniref:Uncharacterized protein n=1 Tax=Fimbriiglobus ruber TaxID=1908690 RepID=A0A225D7H3_9BACT|nr:hypothetical protein [Fimbriiglobus ruber]OWK37550.1 hypothetical protein FRUB_06670 [Fimbriiglobus ruber]